MTIKLHVFKDIDNRFSSYIWLTLRTYFVMFLLFLSWNGVCLVVVIPTSLKPPPLVLTEASDGLCVFLCVGVSCMGDRQRGQELS